MLKAFTVVFWENAMPNFQKLLFYGRSMDDDNTEVKGGILVPSHQMATCQEPQTTKILHGKTEINSNLKSTSKQ